MIGLWSFGAVWEVGVIASHKSEKQTVGQIFRLVEKFPLQLNSIQIDPIGESRCPLHNLHLPLSGKVVLPKAVPLHRFGHLQ